MTISLYPEIGPGTRIAPVKIASFGDVLEVRDWSWNLRGYLDMNCRPLSPLGPPMPEPIARRQHVERLHADADKRPPHKGLCYFIGGDVGAIKIGFSVSVKSRLQALRSASPIPLDILATCPGGEARETAYHFQFDEHRLHGEWFERHHDILAEIERLNASAPTPRHQTVGGSDD
jgi:hypothetical protein